MSNSTIQINNLPQVMMDSLILVTTKGNSKGEEISPLHLPLMGLPYIEVAIGQVHLLRGTDLTYSISKLLTFENEEDWIRIENPNFNKLELPKICKTEKNIQIFKPVYILLFRYEKNIIALSQRFLAKSCWGKKPQDAPKIIKRVKEIRDSPPVNENAIMAIQNLKAHWRRNGAKENKSKLEKATWLQLKLLNDPRPSLILTDRVKDYCKNAHLTFAIAQEIEHQMDLNMAPPPPPLSPVPVSNSISSDEIQLAPDAPLNQRTRVFASPEIQNLFPNIDPDSFSNIGLDFNNLETSTNTSNFFENSSSDFKNLDRSQFDFSNLDSIPFEKNLDWSQFDFFNESN